MKLEVMCYTKDYGLEVLNWGYENNHKPRTSNQKCGSEGALTISIPYNRLIYPQHIAPKFFAFLFLLPIDTSDGVR